MGGASKAVAIKLLAAHLAEKPVYRRMFVDEARLTMMLTHSNIVQVFDVGEQGGRSYLVMEWVDGLDLARLAESLREAGLAFDLHVVAHIIGEVLRGLAYAHGLTEGDERSTIVHRDISPHNVIISVSGEVKISDFGVARLASEETSGLHVRGKLRYMPPEQLRGDSKAATIDLFAVGAMLQELLDGVRFRAGLERDNLVGMVISGEVPPLLREDLPEEIVALRDGLLAPRREDRIQTAQQALALLRRWPGYRNAADELADLVRPRAGVAAPRSGLTVAFSDEELEAADEPTVREGSVPPVSEELATRTVPTSGAAASQTAPSVGDPGTQLPELAASLRGGRLRARAWLGLLGGALVVSLGVAQVWPSGDARPQAVRPAGQAHGGSGSGGVARAEAPLVVAAAPARSPAPERSPAQTPRDAPPSAAAQVEPESTPPSDELESPKPDEPPADDPATVEFAAHEFFFVYVKVGKRVRALEPLAKLSLKPGRHRVFIRESESESWRAAGAIRVEAGQRYKVALERPAGLSLRPKT